MDMIPLVAARSKDPNTKTGCIIVGPDHEIRTTGYNSFPRGIVDNVPMRLERPEKYFWIEHAERNAIYNAARVGVPLLDCTLYLNWLCCMDCARAIIQVGITHVVVDREEHERKTSPKWEADHERVVVLFRESCIDLYWWRRNHGRG